MPTNYYQVALRLATFSVRFCLLEVGNTDDHFPRKLDDCQANIWRDVLIYSEPIGLIIILVPPA